MVSEDIVVRIKTVAEIKALANTVQNLRHLKRAGVDVSKPMAQADKRMGQLGVTTKKASGAFGRFQMELLGVLFFGMAVQKFLTGLLKPAFNLIGTFELLNTILGAAFLPTALKINDVLIDMALKFLDLDESTREFYGDIIALFAALFFGMMLFGMVGLGLNSLGTLFGTTGGAAALFMGKIIALSAAIIWLVHLMDNWKETSDTTKAGTIALTTAVAGLLLKFSPLSAIMLELTALVIALRLGWDALKGSIELSLVPLDKIHPIFRKIADAGKDALDKIKEFAKFLGFPIGERPMGPEDVLAASDIYNRSPAVAPPTSTAVTTGDINISIDMASIETQIDEIAKQINESITTQLGNITRGRP